MIYKASVRGEQKHPSFAFVWHNFAPPRVRFFAWLLTQNSIHCKVNLSRKGIVHEATCDICTKEDEDADHIISGCEFARQFWLKIGWNPDDIHHVDTLWSTTPPPSDTKESCINLDPSLLLGIVEAPT